MDHDQNFKNLILDYPREALDFFAAEEAGGIAADTRIVPLREEQAKERLGERFRELDTPLLVEWADGQREALLFVLEEETEAGASTSTAWASTAWTWRSCSPPTGWCLLSSSCARAMSPTS